MEYRIGDKKFHIYPQHLTSIGEGKEGIVYKWCGKVLKLYHDFPRKQVLSFRDCQYMTGLNTKRVLLPQEIVLDKKHRLKGYTMSPFISSGNNIYKISCSQVLGERDAIHQELIYLGENFVSVDDIWVDNFRWMDKFYLLDPGSYKVHFDMMEQNMEENIMNLAKLNVEYFDMFFCNGIILKYVREYLCSSNEYKAFFYELHARYLASGSYSKMNYITKYMLPNISLEESIKQLVKAHQN